MSLDLLTSSTPSFLNRGADTYARLIIFSAFGLEGLCKITVSPESTAFTLPSIGRGAIMEAKWTSAVIKPCISASSHNTWVTTRRTASQDNAALNKLLQHQDLIIQEFVDEICSNGEISLMFFDGTYSHSVIKKPTPGDFRVQETFGGKTSAYAPRSETIEKAAEILQLVNGELLYARVDGVEKDGAFCLMELELIEPVLFFRHGPHSAKVFAEAMERLLQKV